MKKIFALILTFTTLAVYGQTDDWFLAGVNVDGTYKLEAKSGSGQMTKNQAGEFIYVAIFRATTNDTIVYEKQYVKWNECNRGYGQLITTDMQGKFKYANDYVLGNGGVQSIAASVATDMCVAYKRASERNATEQSKSKGQSI
jgi:hypothetical protein